MTPDDDSTGIGLAQVLEDLRAELAEAQRKASGTNMQFPVQSVTIELKVAVTRTKDGKAGFRVPYVGVELGGSLGVDHESLQTITLVLEGPVDSAGRRVKVASQGDEMRK